jgi:hypothetical protein
VWARNLLFAGVCLAALAALHASVFPRRGNFERERRPLVPTDVGGVAAEVDALLAAQWSRQNVAPAPRADELQIARRLSLGLMGTIPSVAEIRWLESIPNSERIDRWLERIFADRRYSDYVAERFARALVGTDDGPFLLYRRRRFVSWLADQLHSNRPYDQVVTELIADAGLWTDTPATNFLTANIKPDSDEDPDPSRLAGRVARAFLGVRIDCAECHDHPFDQWKQEDFRRLAAFFAQTKRSFTGIADRAGEYEVDDRKTGKRQIVPAAVPFQAELLPDSGTRRERLAAWITHRDNQAFARAAANRAWAILFGRPLLEPIDNIPPAGDAPTALDVLAGDFVEHGYDLRRLFTAIAKARAFQLDSRAAEGSELDQVQTEQWAAFPMTRLRPEQVVGGILQASSLSTVDYQSHILVRLARQISQSEFIKRYGDTGSDEFDARGGTIPQRLLMMNGDLVKDKTGENLVANAVTRIAVLAPSDERAVEVTMLAVLSRRPTAEEADYVRQRFATAKGMSRRDRLEDLYWTLLNTTEFSWNH